MRYAIPIGRTSSGGIVCQVFSRNPLPKVYGMSDYQKVQIAAIATQKVMTRRKARAGSNPTKTQELRTAGLGELKRIAGEEFKRIARVGVPGTSRRIERELQLQHSEALQDPRELVRDLQAAGGLRRPPGMTAEEWRSRTPRALHHRRRKGPGIALDIYAQDLADQGRIDAAYGDEALDFIIKQYEATRDPAPKADPKDLRRQARKIVDRKAREVVRELVGASRVQAQLACPPGVRISRNPRRRRRLMSNPAARRLMKSFHGDIRRRIRIEIPKLPDTAYQVGRLDAVIYTPPRWSKIGPWPRVHHFDKPQPRLIGFNSRPPWMIVGGSARFTSRGFVG